MSAVPGVTYAFLDGLLKATIPQVDRSLQETQLFNTMPGNKLLINNAEEKSVIGNTYSWSVRMRAATGTTQALRPYQATTYSKAYYSERFTVPFRDKVNTSFVFDRLELARNMSSPERVYELIKEARSAQREDIANTNEAEVFGAPDDNNDDTAILGLEVWARRSMDSGGVFVANPDGGFTGTYWRGRNGTITPVVANQDLSLLTNERARNWNATHNGVMDRILLRQIKVASIETEFEMLDGLEGDKGPQGEDCIVFMDPDFVDSYDELLATGPDPRYQGGTGDYYPGKQRRVYGLQIVRTPALRGKVDRPVFGVRRSLVNVIKGRGMWMVEGEVKPGGTHNVVYKPMDYTWQMYCKDMRKGCFRIHGSFVTGT